MLLSLFRTKRGFAATLGIFSAFPAVACAANWEIAPSISIAETYSDNVRLASEEEGKQTDLVTQIEPAITLKGDGHYGSGSLSYSAQGRLYKEQEDSNRVDHRLLSSAKFTLFPKHLFLDASGTISQELLSPHGDLALQDIAATENKSTVTTINISPYAILPIGNAMQTELRYKHGEVLYEKDTSPDTQSDEANVTLSGFTFSRSLLWSLAYQDTRVNYSDREVDESNRKAIAGLRYSITSSLSSFGNIGYEEYEGLELPGRESPSGKLWKLGLGWQPSEKTSFEVDVGRQFFGSTKGLKLTHQTPHSSWSADYREELSSRRQLQLERADASIISSITNAPPSAILYAVTTVSRIFIRKAANLNYALKTTKTETGFNIYHETREFEGASSHELLRGTNVFTKWSPFIRSSFGLRAGWQHATDEPETFHRMVHYYELSMDRKIRPTLHGTLTARRNRQYNTMEMGSYIENLLTAKLTYFF